MSHGGMILEPRPREDRGCLGVHHTYLKLCTGMHEDKGPAPANAVELSIKYQLQKGGETRTVSIPG